MRRCSAPRCACRRSTARWSLSIPPNTSSGRVFRLKGKGLPGKPSAGDLYATVKIVLPDGKDAELEELMKKWRERQTVRSAQGSGLSAVRGSTRPQ